MPLSPFGSPSVRLSIPPELENEAALLAYLKLSAAELKNIRWFRGRMYQTFSVGSPPRKVRTINAPNARLKHLQRLLTPLLTSIYRVRHPVHGFVAGKSVKTNAESHLKKRFIVNLDLQDFFPSISERRIVGMLRSLGVDSQVAKIVGYLCTSSGELPQGAPTSPILSNMICFRLDKALMTFARESHCIYTRYADDITLSSYQPMVAVFDGTVPAPGHFPIELLKPALRSAIETNGFTINVDKIYYADPNSRRMVTGLKVNEFVNVDRRYVRNLRAALCAVKALGHAEAQKKFETQYGGKCDLVAHLTGKMSWLGFIRGVTDPVYRSLALRFNAEYPDQKIEIVPTDLEIRDRAVWVLENPEFTGTAFFLKGVGLVTAAHNLEGFEEVELFHASKHSNKFKAKPLRVSKDFDLAILDHGIPETEFYELERAGTQAATGDETTAVGFPNYGFGDRLNVREGKVSSMAVQHGVQLIEVDQKLSQGMSGGPLLNDRGQAVGVIHKGGPDEPRDFAVQIDQIDKF